MKRPTNWSLYLQGLNKKIKFISTIGSEALVRAENLRKSADVIAAITIDTLSGKVYAFDNVIHEAKKHKGQSIVASVRVSLVFIDNSILESPRADRQRLVAKSSE